MNTNHPPYYLQCGSSLQAKMQDGRSRNVCPSCCWANYEQLKVGAALVEQDGKNLLLLEDRAGIR